MEGRKTVPEQLWERVYLFPFYILFISIFCPFVCDVCVDVAHFIALLSYPLGCNFKILHTLLASGPRRVKLSSIYISCITFPVLFFFALPFCVVAAVVAVVVAISESKSPLTWVIAINYLPSLSGPMELPFSQLKVPVEQFQARM